MAENTSNINTPSVKKYVDYAQQQVDEQAILDKFNAATMAQYNAQREQNRQNENAFYNQMYQSQQTAVDAIRQANAAAISSGASRGIQAANELSAILGLEQESVASATELAQANRQTAQEETAAMLENVLTAYQQAEQERQNLVTAGIQAASIEVEQANAEANKLNTLLAAYAQAKADGDTAAINKLWGQIQQATKLNPEARPEEQPEGVTTNTNVNTYWDMFGTAITEDEIKAAGYDPATTLSENDLKKIAASKGIEIPIDKSGIQYDGTLKFSSADLNDKNISNIRNALKEAGYKYNIVNDILNLNNSEEWDKIKQIDFSTKKSAGEAGPYIAALIKDSKNGTMPIGAVVEMNYGAGTRMPYINLGGGMFVPITLQGYYLDNKITSNLYAPAGYRISTSYVNGKPANRLWVEKI